MKVGKTTENRVLSDIYDVYDATRKAIEEPTVGNIAKAAGKAIWLGVSNFTPVGRAASAIIDIGSGIFDLFE